MIGSLRGTVLERTTTGEVLLEVGGIGYRINVPLNSLLVCEPNAALFVFTHQHVREDAIVLYGFLTRDERDTFEALIGATGVGPKLALAILSVHSPSSLRRIFLEDDADALTAVSGVGKRTAQRLLVECKSRLQVPDLDLVSDDVTARGSSSRADVRAALLGLGYGEAEVRSVLASLEVGDDADTESLLRDALKALAVAR
jgi:Holliday junction DNA helicase RuvA